MRRSWLTTCCLVALLSIASVIGVTERVDAEGATTDQKQADVRKVGTWQPPSGLKQSLIWPHGAPDMTSTSLPPESVETAQTPEALGGHISEAVFDVSVPTMTVFPPRGRNTGVAVIVFPGGGFQALAITLEGTEICDWLTAKGMTCILSKYRVPKSNHYWDEVCRCAVTPKVPFALQDAQRTIRLVRGNANDLHIDPNKIGVMGFSAGGYLVAQTSNIFAPAYKPVDALDKSAAAPTSQSRFIPDICVVRARSIPEYTSRSERRRPSCCKRGTIPSTRYATARYMHEPLTRQVFRLRSTSCQGRPRFWPEKQAASRGHVAFPG